MPDISEFEKLITPKTKAILICNPGNPTGYLYSKQEIQTLAAIVKKHDLFLVADEVYREFTYDDVEHYSILEEPGMDQYAIIIDSVSKRYSMCGARIGCLVSKNKAVLTTALKFAQARLSPPTFAQIASEAALSTPQSYFDQVTKEYKDRRDILIEKLKEIAKETVDIKGIGFYSLGSHRKGLNKDQLINYQNVFEEYFLKSFSSRLAEYSNPEIEVISKNVINKNYTIVLSKLVGTESRPEVKIEWRVYTKNPDNLLIRDLIIEGLSLARTQKEEFNSIVNSNEGNIEALLKSLTDFSSQ